MLAERGQVLLDLSQFIVQLPKFWNQVAPKVL